MGLVIFHRDYATSHEGTLKLTDVVLDALAMTASAMGDAVGLPDLAISVRVTDDFVAEAAAGRGDDLPPYTTDRLGGVVAARSRHDGVRDGSHQVLVNAAIFRMEDSWAVVHLPATIAHEVAHCLIAQCRHIAGNPAGYVELPCDPVEAIAYVALTVCDEYLADELAKLLLPEFPVSLDANGQRAVLPSRLILGTDRLARASDDLDCIYPALRDRVQLYRITHNGLDEMTNDVISAVHGSLVMSAHYHSAVRELPQLDEAEQVAGHPGMKLYLEPFWERMGPVLDSRIHASPLTDFSNCDQATLDAAIEAVAELLATAGLIPERLRDGAVFVHVGEPAGF